MITEIDYEALSCAVLDVYDESLQSSLNMDTILKTAKLVWDNTAVEVKSKGTTMIFDLISYELMDYTGFDA